MSDFKMNDYDRQVYDTELRDFLPDKIFDAHVHIATSKNKVTRKRNGGSSWPGLVSHDHSVSELMGALGDLFPGKETSALIFGMTLSGIDETNNYVIESNRGYNLPMLYRTEYSIPADELEAKVKAGGFLGLKPYLTCAPSYIPSKEVRIFDFLPKEHLEVANRNGWIVMLHISREARLRDPLNLAQLLEIEEKYPNVKLIVAHIGRAYAREDFGDAFEVLKSTKNMRFDFTANLFDEAIIEGIKCVGTDRFIYGTDFPIAYMRLYREVKDGTYCNVVPKGLYGDVTGIPHVRDEENDKITLMVYEQLRAFKRAAAALKLSDTDVEKIMYSNAKKLIDSVK